MHWHIASLAVESGISPNELLKLEPRMLFTIERYLVWRSHQQKQRRR